MKDAVSRGEAWRGPAQVNAIFKLSFQKACSSRAEEACQGKKGSWETGEEALDRIQGEMREARAHRRQWAWREVRWVRSICEVELTKRGGVIYGGWATSWRGREQEGREWGRTRQVYFCKVH